MLSVCIPIYNFDVVPLVRALSEQAQLLKIDFEILIIDDASGPAWLEKNNQLTQIQGVRYICLQQNIGRSQIRNMLAREAIYNNLLFIDCDAVPVSNSFLKNYVSNISECHVIAGGVAYQKHKPESNRLFRWRYGIKRESTPAHIRSKKPYQSFKTFNFLISKRIFNSIKFDESITGYGHEDTLFGIALKDAGIKILHINNPLFHQGIEPNEVFLEKTHAGIINLYKLYLSGKAGADFISSVSLLKTFCKLPQSFKKLLAIKYSIFAPFIKLFIFRGSCPMFLFDLYKLMYLCSLKNLKNEMGCK